MNILELTLEHYEAVIALWRRTPGICVRDADSREAITRYLARNPGLSFVALIDGELVGTALSGHDGRRGYLQHVAVDERFRGRGIAQALVSRCLEALARESIDKVHLEVLADNEPGNRYWERRGWTRRHDLHRYSLTLSGRKNA
jgi:Acetyltransferases